MNIDDRLKVLQAIHGGQGARSYRRAKLSLMRRIINFLKGI